MECLLYLVMLKATINCCIIIRDQVFILKITLLACRDALLSYIAIGDDVQVMGSINVMATLLQAKGCITVLVQLMFYSKFVSSLTILLFAELDESMLDALGILPERKKHKKLLLVNGHTNYCYSLLYKSLLFLFY